MNNKILSDRFKKLGSPGDLLDYSVDSKKPPEADKVFSLIKRKRAKRKNLLQDKQNNDTLAPASIND
ncbi:MAG: hypothetical protein KME29_08925 [Calothrix sp. FI2-JRJ7]|jgi:hypothetical protein|nr:hypothetical protein [Calothrix sp. FI2-JRJ7]